MDEGFEEQLDIYDVSDSVECAIPPNEWQRYCQERIARQTHYFEKKNDFIFTVRLAFFNIHAFDVGAITYDDYCSLLTLKVEKLRKYASDLWYPFRVFEFIVYAIFCGEEWHENTINLFNDLYLMAFPELAEQIAAQANGEEEIVLV